MGEELMALLYKEKDPDGLYDNDESGDAKRKGNNGEKMLQMRF